MCTYTYIDQLQSRRTRSGNQQACQKVCRFIPKSSACNNHGRETSFWWTPFGGALRLRVLRRLLDSKKQAFAFALSASGC
ncbi:unnamed protein product [Amoebophrya sp. A120]|nr:unnamed protein product [Amoebophrya sp. A120]|eukprot:GSA120T00008917001.1